MSKECLRIGVTGLDGSGKTSVVEGMAEELALKFKVGVAASLVAPPYVIRREERLEVFPDLVRVIKQIV